MNHSSRLAFLLLPWWGVLGCPEPTLEGCGEFDQVFAWEDADGDGFGAHVPLGWQCQLRAGQSANDADCDDARDDVFPAAEEVCDLADNDCDGLVDEDTPYSPWYPDEDGDGWGDGLALLLACQQPGPQYTRTAGDCDDTRPDVNPEAPEICNEGIDDDCDGFADDADAAVDPASQPHWHRDLDRDGYGDPYAYRAACEGPRGAVLNDADCDDTDPDLSPDGSEVCDHIDNDCDGLIDDEDPDVDPAGFQLVIADYDHDKFGNPDEMTMGCWNPPFNNRLDCDDHDPLATIEQDWFRDDDGDLSGAGQPQAHQCLNPGGGLAPGLNGQDCEPSDPAIYPGQREDCFDGVDQDCDRQVDCADSECIGVPGCTPPCADQAWSPGGLPASQNGSTIGQGDDFISPCGFANGAPDVAFWFTPPRSGNMTFDTVGSNYDTVLYAYTDCGGQLLRCNDDTFGLQSRISFTVTAGTPVLIVVDGYSSGQGSYVLNVQ
ncbi:MAG: putative metal-binding motif-containing protein [Myxococcales bacterium]|nr:putative metal-binding motif-containing protein [Myxococcales bacterium]